MAYGNAAGLPDSGLTSGVVTEGVGLGGGGEHVRWPQYFMIALDCSCFAEYALTIDRLCINKQRERERERGK